MSDATTPEEIDRKTRAAIVAVGALLETLATLPAVDRRCIAVARTEFETGFLWAASALAGGSVL